MPIGYVNLFGLSLVTVTAPLLADLLRISVPDASDTVAMV